MADPVSWPSSTFKHGMDFKVHSPHLLFLSLWIIFPNGFPDENQSFLLDISLFFCAKMTSLINSSLKKTKKIKIIQLAFAWLKNIFFKRKHHELGRRWNPKPKNGRSISLLWIQRIQNLSHIYLYTEYKLGIVK